MVSFTKAGSTKVRLFKVRFTNLIVVKFSHCEYQDTVTTLFSLFIEENHPKERTFISSTSARLITSRARFFVMLKLCSKILFQILWLYSQLVTLLDMLSKTGLDIFIGPILNNLFYSGVRGYMRYHEAYQGGAVFSLTLV